MTVTESGPLASLDLLRRITDRHVVDQLLAAEALTRAEIAARTGISRPTISESMRRLEAVGLVGETGRQVGRRGRAGTFYALRDDAGRALAVSAGPEGLVAEVRGVRGDLVERVERAAPSPVAAAELGPLLRSLVEEALTAGAGPLRASSMSVANPVDRRTGVLVHLPNSPFLVDEFRPAAVLADLLGPELDLDNDVNWAALAEDQEGNGADLADFCYCHLGFGLGGAVMRGGRLVRGAAGLAGELAHVLTHGPGGRSLRLIECFAALDLLLPGSEAIDVTRVRTVLEGRTGAGRRARDVVVDAVAGALSSVTALLNPAGVVVGGPWSSAADFGDRLRARVDELAVVRADVRLARLGDSAPLIGARLAAVRAAQESLLGPPAA